MDTLLQDLRYAVRKLRASPGFTLAALASLALGIGATTAIFSVVNGVLLKPLPYEDPGRLVMVWEHNIPRGWARHTVSSANFFAWSEQGQGFEHLAALFETSATVTGGGDAERVGLVLASASLFPLLGVQPVIGRAYRPEEDREGAPRVAVLGHGFWQRRFGGDPGVIGRALTLGGRSYTVVGVAPRGLEDPQLSGLGNPRQIWRSTPAYFGDDCGSCRAFTAIARLRAGVTRDAAASRFAGRRAIVTGASRGIGKESAVQLARAGFDVAVAARTRHEGEGRDDSTDAGRAVPGSLETTAAEIEAVGRRALALRLDLHDRSTLTAAIAYPFSQGMGLTLGQGAGGYVRGGEKYLGSFGALVSDDNYHILQRTLLLQFRLNETGR